MRATGWVVSRRSKGVASTAKPLPEPSISSVDWQQASPSRFTPKALSFRGDGPCVVLSMISKSASPLLGDSGSMLLCLGLPPITAGQPSRARSVGALAALLVDRFGAGAASFVRRARRGEGIRSLRGNWGDTRATRGRFWRAFGRFDCVFGAPTGRGALLRDARRPGRHTPEYMHYSEHHHANQARKTTN